jgi:hypothetical protein
MVVDETRRIFLRAMKNAHLIHRLGIDIGRVIIHGDGPDTSFVGAASLEDALRAPAMEGAFESIARLVSRLDRRVWLVSKCGKRVEERTRAWLDHHRFFEATGIPAANIRFCRERKEKAGICVGLGITMFVDDRIDVLRHMASLVPHRLLFGAAWSPDPGVVPAPTWTAAEALVDAVLDEAEIVTSRRPGIAAERDP